MSVRSYSSFSLYFRLLCAVVALVWQTCVSANLACYAAGREIPIPDVQFRPIKATQAVTVRDAVETAIRNYPLVANKQFELRAAIANVGLAYTQWLPNLNWDIQESGVTPNRVASVVMNNVSGFDTVPVDSGPPAQRMRFAPVMNNLQGLNLNWLVLDGGLRHANDEFAAADARAARADLRLTKLDVAFEAAHAFLVAAARKEEIRAAQAALDHIEAANLTARTLVSKGLRPGVDYAGWDLDVARARINVIKAQKEYKLALADLAERMGLAHEDLDIVTDPIIRSPIEYNEIGPFNLTGHPLALFKTAEVDRWKAKVRVLDVAWRPHLWMNSSVWGKGAGEQGVNPIGPVAGGVLPQVFNYMIGVSLSFPMMEYFPLKYEKRMAYSHQMAAQANLNLAMQVLEKRDARARIMLDAARKVAEQTPILVQSAEVKEVKTMKRYRAGLTNMVAVAEAEKSLAEAEVADAIAQVEVWRSILHIAYLRGELNPFLKLVSIAEGNRAEPSPMSGSRR